MTESRNGRQNACISTSCSGALVEIYRAAYQEFGTENLRTCQTEVTYSELDIFDGDVEYPKLIASEYFSDWRY